MADSGSKTAESDSDMEENATVQKSAAGVDVSAGDCCVRLIASTEDCSKRCEFDICASTTYSDLMCRLGKELQLDDFDCTYSLNKYIANRQGRKAPHELSITCDVDVMAAVFTASTLPDKLLYVKVDGHFSGALTSLTLPVELRSLSQWKKPLSEGSVQEWDLMEDMAEVKDFWKELPPIQQVPFAHMLNCYNNHLQQRNLSERVQALTHRGALHEFDWRTFLDADLRLVRESDLRLRVYHCGVAPSLRPVVWRHLLFVFPPLLSGKERRAFLKLRNEEYERLKAKWVNVDQDKRPQEVVDVIDQVHNDVMRTDRKNDLFREDDSPHLNMLFNVLVTFALNSPDISYVQGLNDYAAVFLQVYGNEADTYICLHSMMRLTKTLFTPEGLMVKFAHLKALLRRFDNDMHEHLSKHNSQELIFCYRWLLLDMKREFSRVDSQRIFEVLWSTLSPPKEYMSSLRKLESFQCTVTKPSSFTSQQKANTSVSEVLATKTSKRRSGQEQVEAAAASVPNYVESQVKAKELSWTLIHLISDGVDEYEGTEVLLTPEDSRLAELGEAALTESVCSSDDCAGHKNPLPDQKPPERLPQESEDHDELLGLSNQSQTALAYQHGSISLTSPQKRLSLKGVANQMASFASAATLQSAGDISVAVGCSEYTMIGSDVEDGKDIIQTLEMSDACEASTFHSSNGTGTSEIWRTYGSFFILFMCVGILTLHRKDLLQQHVSEETLAMYFDEQRKHHSVDKILAKARRLFAQYLHMEMAPLINNRSQQANPSVMKKLLQRHR